jgi:hypothetical protein
MTFITAPYFPKGFEDPYIAKNERQELAYHLEATAGMILGLARFVDNTNQTVV